MSLIESALNPSLARLHLPESLERAWASLALRQLWHVVFDPCPTLLASAPQNGKPLLEDFLEHAAKQSLSMDWRLHAELLIWMWRQSDSNLALDATLSQELLAASASRWCMSDLEDQRCLLLVSGELPGFAIVGEKAVDARQLRRVGRTRFARDLKRGRVECATLSGLNDEIYEWRSITSGVAV